MAARERKPVVANKSPGPGREKLLTSTLRKYNSLAEAKKELLRLSQDIDPAVKRPVGRPRKNDLLETRSTSGDGSPRTGRLKKRLSRISGGLEAGNGVGRNSPYSFRSQGLLRNGKRRTLDGTDFPADFGPSRRRRVSSLCGSVDDLRPVGRKPGRPPSLLGSPAVSPLPPPPKAKVVVKKEPGVFQQADGAGGQQQPPPPQSSEADDDGSNLGRHISSRIAALIKKSKVSEILQKYSEAKASRKAAAENEKKLMDTNSNLCAVTAVPPSCDRSVAANTKEGVKAEEPAEAPVKYEGGEKTPTESATSLSAGDKGSNLCKVPAGGDVAPHPLASKVQDIRGRGNLLKTQKTVSAVCNLRKAARKRILKVEKVNSVKRKIRINKNPRKVVGNQRTSLTAKKLVGSGAGRRPRSSVAGASVPFQGPAVSEIKTEPPFTNEDEPPEPVNGSDKTVALPKDVDGGSDNVCDSQVVDVSVTELSEASSVKSETVVSSLPCEDSCPKVEDTAAIAVNGLTEEGVEGETKDEGPAEEGTKNEGPGGETVSKVTESEPVEEVTKDDVEVVSCDDVAVGGGGGGPVEVIVDDDAKESESAFAGGESLATEEVICCDGGELAASGDKDGSDVEGVDVGVPEEMEASTDDKGEVCDRTKCLENGELDAAVSVNTDEEDVAVSSDVNCLEPESPSLNVVNCLESESSSLNVVPIVSLEENSESSDCEDGAQERVAGSVSDTQPDKVGPDPPPVVDVVEESPPTEELTTETEETLSPPAEEDRICSEAEGVVAACAPEPEKVTEPCEVVVDEPEAPPAEVQEHRPEAEEPVGDAPKLDDSGSKSVRTSPAGKTERQSSVGRRRRSAAVKEKRRKGCLKRSLSAECTSRDVRENNQRRGERRGSKEPETTYIIISKEKDAERDPAGGSGYEITVGSEENGLDRGQLQQFNRTAPEGDGDGGACMDGIVVGEVKTLAAAADESSEALEGILDKLEASEARAAAKVVAEESAEEQAVKESVLRALGLTSWRAAQEARQGSAKGDGEPYTGTLKTVIKVQRSPEKRRRSLKMVLKHCSTRNGASSQGGHPDRGHEDRQGEGHVEYRICKEGDSSTTATGGSFGLGNRKYSKTSQGYRYLSEHDSNSSSSGNAAGDGKGVEGSPEPKEEGKSDKSSLVIPEKSASFSIHPGRLCSDVCSYCFGKFGSLDTPCHIAQLKSSDRQRKILETETHLTLDSCLCDACYRHVDRKANCPSYKPTRKRHHNRTGGGSLVGNAGANTCSAVGCEEAAQHHVRRKWLLKLKRSISKKVPLDMEKPHLHFPFCQQHFNWIDYYMVCGICSRRLTRSHMYTLGGSEVRDLNAALVRDGIPARVSEKRFLCKLCRYYASLRAKCRDPAALAGNQKMFFESYRKRILQYHDIEVASEPEEPSLSGPKAKRKKSKGPPPTTTTAASSAAPAPTSVDGTSESSSGGGAAEDDRLQAGTPMIDYSNLASLGASLTVTPVPARAAPRRRDDEDELPPVQASFSFHGPGSTSRGRGAADWERCTANLQFTAETKQLFQTLQRPYGSHSSFMRHLVLMEKFWRQGDLVLAPRASARATNYVNSVQHRLRAFDYVPPTAASFGHHSAGSSANSVTVIPVPEPPVSVVELPLRQQPAPGGGGVALQLGGKTFLYAQPRPAPPRKRANPSAAPNPTVCRISEVRSLAPERSRWSWGGGGERPKGATIVTPTGIVLSRNPEISVSSLPPK